MPAGKQTRSSKKRKAAGASADSDRHNNSNGGGGFTIDCNGEQLEISSEQAKIIRERCEYFRHVFAHGTQESTTGILPKPDWDLATGQAIVQLITTGSVPLPIMAVKTKVKEEEEEDSDEDNNDNEKNSTINDGFSPLREAADQILFPYNILHPVTGCPIQTDVKAVKLMVQVLKDSDGDYFVFKHCDLNRSSADDSDEEESDEEEEDEEEEGEDEEEREEGEFGEEEVEENASEDNASENNDFDSDSDSENESESNMYKIMEDELDWWRQFLNQGFLILQDKPEPFCIEWDNPDEKAATPTRTTKKQKTKIKQNYRVYYKAPLYLAVTHITTALARARRESLRKHTILPHCIVDHELLSKPDKDLTVAFQIYAGFFDRCTIICKDLGVHWQRVFATDGLADSVTVRGTVDKLVVVMDLVDVYVLPFEGIKKCLVLYKRPAFDRLARLIHACQQCKDNQGTFLWDSARNIFFTMKTVQDTKIIFELLSKKDSEFATQEPFTIIEKATPQLLKLGNHWRLR